MLPALKKIGTSVAVSFMTMDHSETRHVFMQFWGWMCIFPFIFWYISIFMILHIYIFHIIWPF